MNKETVAQIAHEANRAYCEMLGDHSQLPWAEAPEWQKNTCRAGVDYHLANPDATPEESHQSWLEQKTADGWKYGPVKDVEKKEHPCFVPYEELPEAQRVKDFLFTAIVNACRTFIQ